MEMKTTQSLSFNVTFEQQPNSDSTYVKNLKKRLKRNNGFCISQPEKTPETKCPCTLYREHNECLCGMYIKVPVYEEDD